MNFAGEKEYSRKMGSRVLHLVHQANKGNIRVLYVIGAREEDKPNGDIVPIFVDGHSMRMTEDQRERVDKLMWDIVDVLRETKWWGE